MKSVAKNKRAFLLIQIFIDKYQYEKKNKFR